MSVLRRIMLSGGIDIDTLPDTQKLYYQATAKVSPKKGSLGVVIIANKWDAVTGEGVIVCNHDIDTIGGGAFSNSTALTSITIPSNITSIGNFVFRRCTGELKINCNLPGITQSSGVLHGPLQESRFTKIIIGSDAMQFGNNAFRECTSIKEVYVEDIKDLLKVDFMTLTSTPLHPDPGNSLSAVRMLYVNGELYTNLVIPDDITSIKNYTFAGCGSLTNAIISSSVMSLEKYAFFNCRNLTNVIIPDSITVISDSAFSHCTSLSNLTIGNSVTSIERFAFETCTSLTSVTIPESVTEIGYGAFNSCTSLTNVYCKAITPPALSGTEVFDNNSSGRKIYVPMESVDAYKSATNWSEYADAIEGYEF